MSNPFTWARHVWVVAGRPRRVQRMGRVRWQDKDGHFWVDVPDGLHPHRFGPCSVFKTRAEARAELKRRLN